MYYLPQLPYNYNELEPYIDAKTMEIHHTKHHQTYIDKLNNSLQGFPNLQNYSINELLQQIDQVPQDIRQAVINNGGGHSNHSLYWQIMTPQGQAISDNMLSKINAKFNTFDAFLDKFEETALTKFGSGWVWLVVNDTKKLEIVSTSNQDSPWMQNLTPILGLDIWEHAYYLHYQNRRSDYIKAWWQVVNWDQVEVNYLAII